MCATPGSCGSVPADWTTAPPVANPANYTPPSTTTAQHPTLAEEHAHYDAGDEYYFRSDDYDDLEPDASAYDGLMTSSTGRPEVRRPLVVDIYAVSDRRHDAARRVVYSWSRDGAGRPITSPADDDDDYEDYDDYSDVVGDGHVTSYLGQPGSRGHDTPLSQSRWREVEKPGESNAAGRPSVAVAMGTAAVAAVAMATFVRV